MTKRRFFLIASSAVAAYLIFLFVVLQMFSSNNQPPTPSPTPTRKPGELEPYQGEVGPGAKKAADTNRLIEKLPYRGKYFILKYDFVKGSFVLNINPNNKKEGGTEFDIFLKENGLSRIDLPNLQTTY